MSATEDIQKSLRQVEADTADNMKIMTGERKQLALLLSIFRVLVLILRYMLSR